MHAFNEYVQVLLSTPDEAAVYEELGEQPQKFVLSLRGAFSRAGVEVVVRKMRGVDEVRAWLAEPKPEPVIVPAARGRRKKVN
jgi:hypothetical protein